MAATEEEPLLVDKGSDQSDAWRLWRRELIEVCLLSGPACLQLFFQVSQVNSIEQHAERTLQMQSANFATKLLTLKV